MKPATSFETHFSINPANQISSLHNVSEGMYKYRYKFTNTTRKLFTILILNYH